ncbi:MAG TPA: hypothetical protein VKS21_10830 [Spirochaetota bacterium]|nr:hypothetical protein [Spirochaetota bacterium]
MKNIFKVLLLTLLFITGLLYSSPIAPTAMSATVNPCVLKQSKNTGSGKAMHFLRRSEIIFFIALPFTILYNKQIMELIHRRGQVTIFENKQSFRNYERLYVVSNSLLWASVISFNSIYEHVTASAPAGFSKEINTYRIALNILRRRF